MSILSEKRARSLEKCYWLHDEYFSRWLANHLEPLGTSICDVGAGNGAMLPYLMEKFDKIFALEPSSEAIRILNSKKYKIGVDSIHCPAECVPLGDGIVDISLAKSSLHHFKNMDDGLKEMARLAKKAIVVVEVIAPNHAALKFARSILPRKEAGRKSSAIFSESGLMRKISKHAKATHCLHYDQFIDVASWLEHSDLSRAEQYSIFRSIANQPKEIKTVMQIHHRNARLVMLRRMALVIGFLSCPSI